MKTYLVGTDKLKKFVNNFPETFKGKSAEIASVGAKVIYDQVKLNVSGLGQKTGNLYNSIYRTYSKENSTDNRAVYYVSYRTGRSRKSAQGTYTIAPHGHLLEYGWVQRYQAYLGKDGNFYTAIRPEMRGKPKPSRRASQSERDNYYVLRKGGPVFRLPKPFLRPALDQAGKTAIDQMIQKSKAIFREQINESRK